MPDPVRRSLSLNPWNWRHTEQPPLADLDKAETKSGEDDVQQENKSIEDEDNTASTKASVSETHFHDDGSMSMSTASTQLSNTTNYSSDIDNSSIIKEEKPRSRWSLRMGGSDYGQNHSHDHNNDGHDNSHNDSFPLGNTHHTLDELDLPPLEPVSLDGYNPNTRTRLMTQSLSEELRNLLPERLQLYNTWQLSYSLEQHGASLHTLYGNVIPKPEKRPGYILAVKDRQGDIFGAYSNEYFHPIETRRFYGNGECFLWKTRRLADGDIRFQAFPYTGVNDFVIFCAPNFLSMGGGDGHYGLWLDDNLEKGVSCRSTTFGNEELSTETNFYVVALEVWKVG